MFRAAALGRLAAFPTPLARRCQASSVFRSLSAPAAPATAAGPAVEVPAALVKELRQASGAPLMECKKALALHQLDTTKAFEWLRKRGAAAAVQKATRTAKEGLVCVHVAADGAEDATAKGDHSAVIAVEVNSETDFVARNADFQAFVRTAAATAHSLWKQRQVAPTVDELLRTVVPSSGLTVETMLTDAVTRIRENLRVTNVAALVAPPSRPDRGSGPQIRVLGAYVHGAVEGQPWMGRSVSAVAMRATLPQAPASAAFSEADARTALIGTARRLAMHTVVAKPRFVSEEDVPADELAREREIAAAQVAQQAAESGKSVPEAMAAKAIEGRFRKTVAESTLLGQEHMVEERGPKIRDFLAQQGKSLQQAAGGSASSPAVVEVTEFLRMTVGEGAPVQAKAKNA